MVSRISPRQALNPLRTSSEEYQVRKRRYESYYARETLFGQPHQANLALEETVREIELLYKLYNLYCKVIEIVGSWRSIPWLEIPDEIDNMIETVEGFGRDYRRLPGVLKGWDDYKELKLKVDNMKVFAPCQRTRKKINKRQTLGGNL